MFIIIACIIITRIVVRMVIIKQVYIISHIMHSAAELHTK